MSHRCRFPYCLLLLVLLLAVCASAEWKEKVLYSFQGGANDGSGPAGGVVLDKAGNLYGATTGWGSDSCAPIGNECGLVYELSPPSEKGDSWTENILYKFKGKSSNDGSVPEGGLVIDNAGHLYGTTASGGTGDCILLGVKAGCGIVYELSPPAKHGDPWTRTILYGFQSGNDGYFPSGDLTFDSKGNLYGATLFGGGKGSGLCDPFYQYCGTVFKLSRPKKNGKWTEQVLHSFAGGTDGVNPNGGLVLDSKGAIYGTTPEGGNQLCNYGKQPVGCGIAFRLVPPTKAGSAWAEEVLHRFIDGNDGAGPAEGAVLGPDGRFYGGAGGGAMGGGIVFAISPASGGRWKKTILYEFSSQTYGYQPALSFLDMSGILYGTTLSFPDSYSGSVFRLKPPVEDSLWTLDFLYKFSPPGGIAPSSCLARDTVGDIYGATEKGGSGSSCIGGCGVVFQISP